MNLWRDLQSANAMCLKAVLFLVAGTVAAAGLLLLSPNPRTAFLIMVCVWAFCRLYYFLFYVIERYIDPAFRFDGIGSALRYLWTNRAKRRP